MESSLVAIARPTKSGVAGRPHRTQWRSRGRRSRAWRVAAIEPSGDREADEVGRGGSPPSTEEGGRVVVAALGHQLELAHRIRQRDPADVLPAQRHHLAVLPRVRGGGGGAPPPRGATRARG